METLLRLLLEAYGLAGHFSLQGEIRDDAGFVGRFDLVCVERRLILEYDGEQHRTDRAQYRRDIRRLDRVREAGWTVIRVHSDDLFGSDAQGLLITRIALRLGLAGTPPLVHPDLVPC